MTMVSIARPNALFHRWVSPNAIASIVSKYHSISCVRLVGWIHEMHMVPTSQACRYCQDFEHPSKDEVYKMSLLDGFFILYVVDDVIERQKMYLVDLLDIKLSFFSVILTLKLKILHIVIIKILTNFYLPKTDINGD